MSKVSVQSTCGQCGQPWSLEHFRDCPADLRADLSTLRSQLKRAQEALRHYGCHRFNCKVHRTAGNECDCGLSAALSSLPSTDGVLVPRELLDRLEEYALAYETSRGEVTQHRRDLAAVRALLASTKGRTSPVTQDETDDCYQRGAWP